MTKLYYFITCSSLVVAKMLLKTQLVLLCSFWLTFTYADEENPVLRIKDGRIRGKKGTTVGQNNTYYAFQGVPYAEPPLGKLRFKNPVKKSRWSGTLNATQDQIVCVQGTNPIVGTEDCLYVNVYTPSLTEKKLTVMVYIHGGGFENGDTSYANYGPDYFIDEGVVVAFLKYRLGIFGFISTEDTVCPGNIGLRDLILGLEWVQSNIGYFGGDPEKVTIFGQSAGSALVSYLLQIPKAKDLFRAAILQSGSSLCLWALNRDPRQIAFDTGRQLGISTNDSKTLIHGLRKVDYRTLQNVSGPYATYIVENMLEGLKFTPVKEPPHEGAIFSQNSDALLSAGRFHRVPTIIGFTSNEAAAISSNLEFVRAYLQKLDIQFTELAPADLTNNEIKIIEASLAIKWYYFGVYPLYLQVKHAIKFLSDDQFNRPVRRTVQDVSRYTPVYFYKFSYEGVLGGITKRLAKGVAHAEDLGYLFRKEDQPLAPENDETTRLRTVRLWTNFAKKLNPTPVSDRLLQNIKWPVVSDQQNLTYLDINTDLNLFVNPFDKEMKFWDKIYEYTGDPPYDTY